MHVIADPLKYNSPLLIDPDRIEPLQVATQLLQTIRGWHSKIVQSRRCVERLELPFCSTRNTVKLTHDHVIEKPFGALVPERFDHGGGLYRIPGYSQDRQGLWVYGLGGSPSCATRAQQDQPGFLASHASRADLFGRLGRTTKAGTIKTGNVPDYVLGVWRTIAGTACLGVPWP